MIAPSSKCIRNLLSGFGRVQACNSTIAFHKALHVRYSSPHLWRQSSRTANLGKTTAKRRNLSPLSCGKRFNCSWPCISHGMPNEVEGGERGPYSPGLASTPSIERGPLSTAQGCKDVTGSIIQRAKCHNARIRVATDRNTNMLELNRQPFFRRSISPQKQL